MHDHTDSIAESFRVLRACQSLDSFGDDDLLSMISNSIGTFSASLHDFDLTLPNYLRVGGYGPPKWVAMTCTTIHIAKRISNFDMNEDEVLCFLKHIHLLYRFDDFVETIPSQYAIRELTSISVAILKAFEQFEVDNSTVDFSQKSTSNTSSSSIHDSGYEENQAGRLAGKGFLEHDMLDLIKRLHESPVRGASKYNQQWYSLELRQLLLAMVQQLSDSSDRRTNDQSPRDAIQPNKNLRMWLHDTGAPSVGTNYQFAFLACLVSARNQSPCFQGPEERYFAQAFAQHVSASWRIWNDVGGRVRDEEEGASTSCSFTAKNDMQSLMKLANFEVECAILAQNRLSELAEQSRNEERDDFRAWNCLEFFRQAVQQSGDIYMAGDPTRS